MKNNTYDIVIVGGGLGGIYSAYRLMQHNSDLRILVLEKQNYIGGRVFTYKDSHMQVEVGAGRIHSSHSGIIGLLRELGLHGLLVENGTRTFYAPSDGSGTLEYYGDGKLPSVPLIKKIILAARKELRSGAGGAVSSGGSGGVMGAGVRGKEYLQSIGFIEYAKKIISPGEVQYIKDTFGYYSELVVMNAYDAVALLKGLLDDGGSGSAGSGKYYSLKGGFSQLIRAMLDEISKMNHSDRNVKCKIMKNCAVKNIKKVVGGGVGGVGGGEHSFLIDVESKDHVITTYSCKKCICALTTNALQRLSIMKPLRKELNSVYCGALCRIYSHFDPVVGAGAGAGSGDGGEVGKGGKVWWHGLPKVTTDNNLRMIIPINEKEGTIMISYTDNIYAEFWNDLYKKSGVRGVNQELRRLMEKTFGDRVSGDSGGSGVGGPKHTNVFYWPCGVGYWKIGADSSAVSRKMIRPFDDTDFFVCGENFSEKYQQWMEGAIETSDRVLKMV